jgi:hypothetical protein
MVIAGAGDLRSFLRSRSRLASTGITPEEPLHLVRDVPDISLVSEAKPSICHLDVELLEDRSLPSSTPIILWQMDPQIALDPAHYDERDLPNTPAYVNPPGGYGLTLNASYSSGVLPTSTFSWTITGSSGHVTHLTGEDPALSLRQGKYKVKL